MDINSSSPSSLYKEYYAPDPNRWILDSGCSAHITLCRSVFHKYTPYKLLIYLATGEVFYAEGCGEVVIDLAAFDLTAFDRDQSLSDHDPSQSDRSRIGGMVLKKV
jgi:hypothetical protein